VKRIWLWAIFGAVGSVVGVTAHEVLSGADTAFTVGNVLLPALPGVITTVLALLAKSPRH
jgi:hypothetical protein